MQEQQYQCPEGYFTYVRQGRGIMITGYQGLAGHVMIPERLPWKSDVRDKTDLGKDFDKGLDRVAVRESMGGELAEMPDSLPVTGISKKVFLSKKYLRSVVIPASVEGVGDWAFAYCDSLREVYFGGKRVTFGKAVFMECPKLQGLYFVNDEDREESNSAEDGCAEHDKVRDGSGRPNAEGTVREGLYEVREKFGGRAAAMPSTGAGLERKMSREAWQKGIGALMAAAVTQMESAYLLDPLEAGSREWLEKWDARMTAILKTPDDEGYSKQILCGEEDYESADLETYLRNSRKKKVRLLLLRLLYPMGLSNGLEKELRRYLLEHTKGCETDETWQVIRDECGDRREFYQLFATLGGLTKENAPQVIGETGEENPEMKAYFLKYQADHFTGNDFFGNLLL